MSFNYYPDVDKLFKEMYSLNRLWFETRNHTTPDQLEHLFTIRTRIVQELTELRQVLNKLKTNFKDSRVAHQIRTKGHYQDEDVVIQ